MKIITHALLSACSFRRHNRNLLIIVLIGVPYFSFLSTFAYCDGGVYDDYNEKKKLVRRRSTKRKKITIK